MSPSVHTNTHTAKYWFALEAWQIDSMDFPTTWWNN